MTEYSNKAVIKSDRPIRRVQTSVHEKPKTLEQLIGNTPILTFPRLTKHLAPGVSLFAKAEWTNPGGSVKDRPALNIILQAEKRGDLRPDTVLLDSTSGNMGI